MEWISVKDRRPDTASLQPVLSYGVPLCNTCCKKVDIKLCYYSNEDGFVYGEYDCSFHATHWMPLPKPPKDL